MQHNVIYKYSLEFKIKYYIITGINEMLTNFFTV